MSPSRKSTHEQSADVQATLLEWIRSARFSAGDKIPTESQLARLLKKPRHVVRSALLALANQGMLVRQVGRGTYVAIPGDPKHIKAEMGGTPVASLAEILEARIALEPTLAKLASARASAAEIDELEKHARKIDAARNVAELEGTEAEVLLSLAVIVRNNVLTAMAHVLVSTWRRHALTRGQDIPTSAEGKRRARDGTQKLIEALRALDPEKAEQNRIAALLDQMQRFSSFALTENQLDKSSPVPVDKPPHEGGKRKEIGNEKDSHNR